MHKNIGKVFNLQAIQLKIYENNKFLLKSDSNTNISSKIYLDLDNDFVKINKKIDEQHLKQLSFSFFLGFITFEFQHFFLFAEQVKFAAKIKNCKFYEIVNVKYICTENQISLDTLNKLRKFVTVFEKGFFFSYDADKNFFPVNLYSNNDFIINTGLTNFFEMHENLKDWNIPLYQGFLSSKNLMFDELNLNYTIMARYGFKNQSVIEVTSFVESSDNENMWYFSFLISTNFQDNLQENILNYVKQNKKVLMINTVNKYQKDSIKKIEQFQKVYEHIAGVSKNFKYQYLRFEDEEINSDEKRDQLYNCWGIFRQMIQYYQDVHSQDKKQQQLLFLIQTQDGINKTCIFTSMEILFEVFKLRLNQIGVFYESKKDPINFTQFYEKMMFNFSKFVKELFQGVSKFYQFENNGQIDQEKFQKYEKFKKRFQEIVHNSYFFLQGKPKVLEMLRKILQVQQKIIYKQNLKILVLTYNVAGMDPEKYIDEFQTFFQFINTFDADMIYLGLQELMELKITFKNIKQMMNTSPLINKWLMQLQSQVTNFGILDHHNLLGLQSFVLINKKTNVKFKIVDTDEIKLGVMNMANKGAIIQIIKANDTLMEFINCHLAPGYGYEAIENRSQHLKAILEAQKNYIFIDDIKYRFFMGDTNFKIMTQRNSFINQYFKNQNCFQQFQKYDEFIYNQKKIANFQKYDEVLPNFPPTFKYQKQTGDFHETKTPAWTDRVFFSFNASNYLIKHYKAFPIIISDHLPVYFLCDVKIEAKQLEKIQYDKTNKPELENSKIQEGESIQVSKFEEIEESYIQLIQQMKMSVFSKFLVVNQQFQIIIKNKRIFVIIVYVCSAKSQT